MKKAMIVLILAVAGSIGRVSAQVVLSDKTGWHKIGEKTLDLASTKAEMSVMGANRFASLRFKVKDAPVTLESADIYFSDGGTQHMNLNESLSPVAENKNAKPDEETKEGEKGHMQTASADMSKEIQLTDAERSIDRIVFTYKVGGTAAARKDRKDKPVVEIWGLKTNWDKGKKPAS